MKKKKLIVLLSVVFILLFAGSLFLEYTLIRSDFKKMAYTAMKEADGKDAIRELKNKHYPHLESTARRIPASDNVILSAANNVGIILYSEDGTQLYNSGDSWLIADHKQSTAFRSHVADGSHDGTPGPEEMAAWHIRRAKRNRTDAGKRTDESVSILRFARNNEYEKTLKNNYLSSYKSPGCASRCSDGNSQLNDLSEVPSRIM